MHAIINLGNPSKDFSRLAEIILKHPQRTNLKITGIPIFSSSEFLLTGAGYGAGMILDCLEELRLEGMIGPGARLVLVGSMGSLSNDILLGDVVIPEPCLCAYYGFEGQELYQAPEMRKAAASGLKDAGLSAKQYKHGSSFAVFDPHTNHEAYVSSLYDQSVMGVDCGEVFIGISFAYKNEMHPAAILYCSDSPRAHIADIGHEEFNRRAADLDLLLNRIAASVVTQST